MAENRRACTACGTPNEEDARFCEGCGASLARVCATCGVEANATARFCRGCGTPLAGQAAPKDDVPASGPVRKTVTVMFADLAGSTTFEEHVDAETARDVIGRYHNLLRSIAERHRAGVTKYIGDGFMAVWGVPEIGPDDAAHAVDAAVDLQEHFVDLAAHVADTHGAELALRVAVNTGEVVVGAGDADLVGDALNVGARLEAECPRGHVVVGEETWRATRGRYGYESLGQVQVKGRTAPVAVYQWLARRSETSDATPFVGRADESRRLQSVFDDAVAARAARLVTVIGDPGVGKSRLASEFTAAQDDVRVVEARCVLEGTVALAPMVEVLRALDLETDIPAIVPERDRLLRDLTGLVSGVAGSVEENFWALRRFVEVLAADRPLLLVLDDIQWADTLLLDFIEHLVEWVHEIPVFVLALARPELRETRPDLVTVSRWVSAAVHLGGLDAGATAELAARVLGAARLPDELLRRLPSSTGGNPLFVRELIGMLAHDGVLVERPAGWRLTIDVDAIAIPPTIHALLASRLERLEAADRRVLEIASVVGSDFSPGAVRALAGSTASGVDLSLNRLRRRELVQPSGAYIGDEPVWRFHHVLIRDVAYRRLLKSDRADLHERLADWMVSGGASVAFDVDEMVARHLEAAHTYRAELGTVDEHTRDLALRSARHYAASARRALDRDELVSAGTQAARGSALATADAGLHAELLLVGCEAFLSAGDVAAGAPLVDDLDHIADEALLPWATCYRCQFTVYTDPSRLPEVDALLQGAIDEFGQRRDHAGLAKAHRVRAGARARLGRIGDAETDLFEALIAARQSGDHRQITAALGAAPSAALWGPSPVPKAGGRCLDVVRMQRMTTAAPSLEATSLRCLAVLELLRGRPDKARTMLADARQVVADLGLRHGLMETELFAGIIESMEGDPVAAEPHFRTALDGLDALGLGADAGQAAALLAKSVLAQGRIDEADEYAAESERLAGRNLKSAIAWRAVRAEILSGQGRHNAAVSMAREAVEVAGGTDLVLDHADACLTLSRVLAAAGDIKGANAARDNANALYAAKEVTSAIIRVDAPIAPAVPAAPSVSDRQVTPSSRLAVGNLATRTGHALIEAMRARDIDAATAAYSEGVSQDDRRRLSGDPIQGLRGARAALERLLEQYTHFETRMLAVRGEHLALSQNRWSDDAGNETTDLIVAEVDDDGKIVYQGRFDEDFDAAYRELERRYYAGEGVAFAKSGAQATEWTLALNRADFDTLFDEFTAGDFTIRNHSRSAFPDRSAAEYRVTLEQLAAMVVSSRSWISALSWLSPALCVARAEREAVGADGEHYAWSFVIVDEFRDGRIASMCEFEADDEDAAFAYAEALVRANTSRLAVTNRACEFLPAFVESLNAHDVDGALRHISDSFVYDDHRRLTGYPIVGLDTMRRVIESIFEQYTHFEVRVLAVRGECLQLFWTRWSDNDGNEATTLYVIETGDDGRIIYLARFDEDDFDSAYRELDHRYYAGEGAAFADGGVTTEAIIALNQRDFDRLTQDLSTADLQVETRTLSAFPNRSAGDLRASFGQLDEMVASTRTWLSAIRWVSPGWSVSRLDREAIGPGGEQYAWTRLLVIEIRGGRLASLCTFEIDDEAEAFAYAEERMRATASRLSVTNQASETVDVAYSAMRAYDVNGIVAAYSDRFVSEDRRRLGGAPVIDAVTLRAAMTVLIEQYSHNEWRVLAVRGDRLALTWTRLRAEGGFETTHLHVHEVGDDGRVIFEARFDGDDFEDAYRELENRYYAGEGAAFAESGATSSETFIALNRGDYDQIFGDMVAPEMHVENRSRSAFADRSVSDLRSSWGVLDSMITSFRIWPAAVCWLSPQWSVSRVEREAVGHDGELYTWTFVLVAQIEAGRVTSLCQFEGEDEDAAFAYAEERMRASASRLSVTNRASDTVAAALRALQAGDADGMVAQFSDSFVYDDRRRLSGNPVDDVAAYRASVALAITQYDHYEWRPVAVRGESLVLVWSRLTNNAGFETSHLHLHEIDDDGRIVYEGRFDGDNFEDANIELDRRYYAGEGAAFVEGGTTNTNYITALNRGEFTRAFNEFAAPGARIESRSRSVFGDRSIEEFRESVEQLSGLVASQRTWNPVLRWLSPNWVVVRAEREAVGHDGEQYTWTRAYVIEVRNARAVSLCEFEIEDEEAAFAYAEERVREEARRLAVANRASETAERGWRAMRAHDVDALADVYVDRLVYDDRRRLKGDPVEGIAAMQRAASRILEQYPRVDWRKLAVRGERLALVRSRWSDDAGNQTAYLHLYEIGDDGRIAYDGRFDEDDFEGAYRELERRYYAGEGAAFAVPGAVATERVIALNRGELDQLFSGLLSPGMRVESRSRSVLVNRSAGEFRTSLEELNALIASVRSWPSALCWLSPNWVVFRADREAVGHDGDVYTWSYVYVVEIRDGDRWASMCEFEIEDEDAAFAYAEERMRAPASRLAVVNRASQTVDAAYNALGAHDVDRMVANFSDSCIFEDRRRLSGDPIADIPALRANIERLLQQYGHFEWRTLAVRGEHLALASSRSSNDAGFETSHLHVCEVDADGLVTYQANFDEDDFAGAYREFERRYFAAEGSAFAEAGTLTTEFVILMSQGDPDELSTAMSPGLRVENRSRSAFGDRSAAEFRASFEELNAMVASVRTYQSTVCWMSPTLVVGRFEREAVGRDGEQYAWTHLHVVEIQGGRIIYACLFDLDDEEAAFAYAEGRIRTATSRLAVTNRSCEVAHAITGGLRAHHVDTIMRCCSTNLVYDDRRRLSGDPIHGNDQFRTAWERILEQYSHFDQRILAVRGDKLNLNATRWSDDSGNETAYLHVLEIDDDGLLVYAARFDDDDFEGAYRELSKRYYAGEAAAFADNGAIGTEFVMAYHNGDFDRLLGELATPGMRFESRSHSVIPDRSIDEFRASIEELASMVSSARTWNSAECWLSPDWCITRFEREAHGRDGQPYEWTWIYVTEFRNGLVASSVKFDIDDEEAAFAYAEERARATTTRLPVTNRIAEGVQTLAKAMQDHEIDDAIANISDQFVYDDRRRLGGAPVRGRAEMRAAVERIWKQYTHFEWRTLAVRGANLSLHSSRWSDDAGNETTHLHVYELGDDGMCIYEGRFDEDDFENAYRELERRYYSSEGAAFRQFGALSTECAVAMNRGDLERAFNEFSWPDASFENRSHTAFPDPSVSDPAGSFRELQALVVSSRTWASAVRHMSPHWCIVRIEREAVGRDGERYEWTWLDVTEMRDNRCTSTCLFDPEDEEAAFAYAEECVRATTTLLPLTNLASRMWDAGLRALQARDTDAAVANYAEGYEFDDRRRLGGVPLDDLRTANARILAQYNSFEGRTLAVRGERLHLGWTRWSNDSDFETRYLIVHEVDETGHFIYEGRFDEDDFEGAYRELDKRYYTGEGAAFAEVGMPQTEWQIAMNQGDLDSFFEHFAPEMRFDIQSRSVFPGRTTSELRASLAELYTWVETMRAWHSAMRWLSPTCCVTRTEREAVGRNGEQYAWTRLYVLEFRDGRCAASCEFELDDEDAAFAHAEERVRATASRLAVTNRAGQTAEALERAMSRGDVDDAVACYADPFVYDDRRRMSGDPFHSAAALKRNVQRILDQYNHFEIRTLAVRGMHLELSWGRWSNESGYESTYLCVHEVGHDGRIIYEARFDEDDFEGAYRELTRRYCAGEGSAVADNATATAEYLSALNECDFDRAFSEFADPDMRVENRTRSGFPDRSAAELRASHEQLNAIVTSTRSWHSVECWLSSNVCVSRHERHADGQDGEHYEWTRVVVHEGVGGRCTAMCEFELEDEEAAFAYAEERVRRTQGS